MKKWKIFCFWALLLLYWLGPLESGSPAAIELHTEQLRTLYYKEIQKGEKSLLLIIYGLTDPLIISTLQKAADRGLTVEVIADPKASRHLAKTLRNNVQLTMREGLGLMHQKILVIDKKRVVLGSSNLTSESLAIHSNLVACFDHPTLAAHITEHLGHKGRSLPAPWRSGPLEFWELPSQSQAADRLIELIDSAHHSLKVGMFTWTHPALTEAVIRAHKRGVAVTAYLDSASSKGASQKMAKRLHEGGVDLHVSTGYGLLHHKTCQVDETTLIIGSLNWTLSAFDKNADCFLVIKELEPAAQEAMKRAWHTLKKRSHPFVLH